MNDTVVVTTRQGKLRGKRVMTANGFTYYSFKGIPYAKPPIGALRFKAPQEPAPWLGVRDALADGAPCPQIDEVFKEDYKGDEDCLFLNVYSPQIPSLAKWTLRAVMVWIHGGAFCSGSVCTSVFGPQFLVEKDVILVTMNYRLGALGFLSTGDSVIPGNNGLKDQVMALRWVQQNIAQFGGDPDNVTLFGESAGGTCVHLHLLSPMSKGLFHRAIAQSGSSLNPWSFDRKPRLRAFNFGKALGFNTDDSQELADFLRTVHPKQLIEAIPQARKFEPERDLGITFFRPTSEPRTSTEEVFLPDRPEVLMAARKFHKLPFITGVVENEGIFAVKEVMEKPSLISRFNGRFELLVPKELSSRTNPDKYQEDVGRIKKFYFGNEIISRQNLERYIAMNGDIMILNGVYKHAKIHSALSPAPVYFYIFTFDGKRGLMKRAVGGSRFRGPCHGDELPYIFHVDMLRKMDPISPEMRTVERIVRLWTNFAKTGNPTPDGDSLLQIKWSPVTTSVFPCMNIGPALRIDLFPEMKKRMEFWEDLDEEV